MKIYGWLYHIETSQLNWIVNQLTGLYIMATLLLNLHVQLEHRKELKKLWGILMFLKDNFQIGHSYKLHINK